MPQTNPLVRNESLSVSTSSIEVSEARDTPTNMRKAILLRNNSPNAADIITIALGYEAAVAGVGIVLDQGQSWSDNDGEGYSCHKGPIYAICATINGVLAVMER